MSYSLEIEGLVSYKHKLEAEIKRLREQYISKTSDLDDEIQRLRSLNAEPPAGRGPWVSSECMNSERNATIERCAQVAENSTAYAIAGKYIAIDIRKLKDEA